MSKMLFIKGTLLLTFTGLLSRLLGFFYRIFLSHTIGAHGLGLFQLVLPLQLLVMAVCASGIQSAISRLTASETALHTPDTPVIISSLARYFLLCFLCSFPGFFILMRISGLHRFSKSPKLPF